MRLAGGRAGGWCDAAGDGAVGGPVQAGQVWASGRAGAPFRLVLWVGRDVIGRPRVRFREGARYAEASGAAWRAWAMRVAAACPVECADRRGAEQANVDRCGNGFTVR